MRELLRSQGARVDAVAALTLFVSGPGEKLGPVFSHESLSTGPVDSQKQISQVLRAPLNRIGQNPLGHDAGLELCGLAVLPKPGQAYSHRAVAASGSCGCDACTHCWGKLTQLGSEEHFYSGNIYGEGADALTQARNMFRCAETLLLSAGMDFGDVVRTWIYLRDIDRDYDALNRARREFFESRRIQIKPASTGVGGRPLPGGHDLSMSIYAASTMKTGRVEVMSTPTLNEAWDYGSDFSRGLKVTDANKVALYLSGTASIDEQGRSVHAGDFERQAERMLANIFSLLDQQGASRKDLVCSITYLKQRSDAAQLLSILRKYGLETLPAVVVEAPLCRPELLCETEAVAVLPLPPDGGQERE